MSGEQVVTNEMDGTCSRVILSVFRSQRAWAGIMRKLSMAKPFLINKLLSKHHSSNSQIKWIIHNPNKINM